MSGVHWYYRLACDECDYRATGHKEADEHEAARPGHWVQYVLASLDDEPL